MKFTPITDPLDGERTVEVHPRPAPLVDADWSRQRFVTGRAVSSEALDGEMENRAGRVRLLGRALRPGVVFGLEVGAAQDPDDRWTVVTVAPGMGVCASGEDVVVPRQVITTTGAKQGNTEINALDLPIHATPSLPMSLDPDETPTLRKALAAWADIWNNHPDPFPIPNATGAAEVEAIRSPDRLDLEASLGVQPKLVLEVDPVTGSFVSDLPTKRYPFLAVLVVEPVVTEELGAGGDANDPCERDPAAEPFEDWRYVDGARLAWFPIMAVIDEENACVAPAQQVHWLTWLRGYFGKKNLSDDQARNRAAWALFDIDSQRNPAPMPWERESVPVALVAWNAQNQIAWIDMPAVVRKAGRWIQGESPVGSSGDPALWQARIEQANGQLADMTLTADEKLSSHLRWLPPAGILPREMYDFDERATQSFPAQWGLSAAPIPIDQLDEVLRTVAPLAPFDLLDQGDEVKLLVPVDPSNWDPRLLQIAAVHPEFHAALREAENRIEILFASRGELRSKIGTLYGALGGAQAVPAFPPDDDPEYQHEWVARTVVWDSTDAMSLFVSLGQVPSGKLLQTGPGLKNASILLLWSAATAATDAAIAGTEVQLLADAFVAAGDGPIGVVPMPQTDPVVLESGPGFQLDGGWTHASMVNREDGLAFADDPAIYIVLGTLDTESLDRAMAWAGAQRLVVLAGGISDTAVEELHWHHHRHPERMPLVSVVTGDPTTRDDRLYDAAIRIGAEQVPNQQHEYRRQNNVGLVMASQTATMVVAATGGTATLITARVDQIKAAIAALPQGPSALRTELVARQRVMEGSAAVLRIPDLIDVPTGGSRVLRTRLAAGVIRRLRLIEDKTGFDGTALLRFAVPARQPDFGTAATQGGLGSSILSTLSQRLEGALTPPDGVRVLSDPEVDLLGTIGIVGLMDVLKEKVNRADDVVDFSFLQIQALTFRIREYLLGRDGALAASSSPLLADLSELIQKNTDPDALQAFFDSLKDAASKLPPDDTSGGTLGSRWLSEAINFKVPRDQLYNILGGYDPRDPVEDLQVFKLNPAVLEEDTSFWLGGDLAIQPEVQPDVGVIGEVDVGGTEFEVQPEVVAKAGSLAESGSAPTTYTMYTKYAAGTAEKTYAGAGVVEEYAGNAMVGTTDGVVATGVKLVDNLAKKTGALAFFGMPQAGAFGAPQAGAFMALSQSFDVLSAPSYVYSPAVKTTKKTTFASVGVAQMVQSAHLVKAMHPVDWTLRSTGLKKRVTDTKAVSLRAEAFRLRGTVTQTIWHLALYTAGLKFPGFIETVENQLPKQVSKALTQALVDEILKGKHDLISADADFGDLISDAVKSLETSAAMLRIVEGRVREVEGLLKACERAKSAVEAQIKAAESRHDAVDQAIAEAKHDLTVTRALLAEERERVDETNARRQRVLDEEVPFIVYHRHRALDLHDDLPIHDVEPSLVGWSIKGVLDAPPPPAPPELREAVDLWRDAPARWLGNLVGLLQTIDQVRAARAALEHARLRAALRLAQPKAAPPARLAGLKGLNLVNGLVMTRKSHMVAQRQPAAALNLQVLSTLTWKQAQVKAAEVMTLDDVLTASDIPPGIPKRVSQELEWIYAVAAHIYRELTQIEPYIRAEWARRMSEFDKPMDLRDLSGLPYWSEVGQGTPTTEADPFRKRELQTYVNWLFGRLQAEPPTDAFGLMNDLVRICILLSAHAPVGQILAGHVDEPVPVEPGRLVPIKLDVSRLRVGMTALITLKGVVEARGIVEDLGNGIATARLISAAKPGLVLQPGDPVRFVEADGVSAATSAKGALIQGASSSLQLMK